MEVNTHLGIMLFASSESTGHKFAICAVSNCVKAGSLRRVLVHHTHKSTRKGKERKGRRSNVSKVPFATTFPSSSQYLGVKGE